MRCTTESINIKGFLFTECQRVKFYKYVCQCIKRKTSCSPDTRKRFIMHPENFENIFTAYPPKHLTFFFFRALGGDDWGSGYFVLFCKALTRIRI